MQHIKSMLDIVYINNQEFENKSLNRVINAMKVVDRKFFVPSTLKHSCYDDCPLPIGESQTISQPSTVAAMLLYAELNPKMDVLEVGAGSGWNACLVSYLVYPGKVFAVERINSLTKKAKNNITIFKENLKKNKDSLIKLQNLTIETVDALNKKSKVWHEEYDRIIITAGIADKEIDSIIREMALKLLKKLGILICPQISGPLILYKKGERNELIQEKTKEWYSFVPLLKGEE